MPADDAIDEPLIINLAATGMVPTRSDSAAVPLTPEEIAADCRRCAAAGASIVISMPATPTAVPHPTVTCIGTSFRACEPRRPTS